MLQSIMKLSKMLCKPRVKIGIVAILSCFVSNPYSPFEKFQFLFIQCYIHLTLTLACIWYHNFLSQIYMSICYTWTSLFFYCYKHGTHTHTHTLFLENSANQVHSQPAAGLWLAMWFNFMVCLVPSFFNTVCDGLKVAKNQKLEVLC